VCSWETVWTAPSDIWITQCVQPAFLYTSCFHKYTVYTYTKNTNIPQATHFFTSTTLQSFFYVRFLTHVYTRRLVTSTRSTLASFIMTVTVALDKPGRLYPEPTKTCNMLARLNISLWVIITQEGLNWFMIRVQDMWY